LLFVSLSSKGLKTSGERDHADDHDDRKSTARSISHVLLQHESDTTTHNRATATVSSSFLLGTNRGFLCLFAKARS